MQKADAHLVTGIGDEKKHNITFFHYENTILCLSYSLSSYTVQLFGHPGD